MEKAGDSVNRVVRAGLVPSMMEIMDATCLWASSDYLATELVGSGDQALLLRPSDEGGQAAEGELSLMEQLFHQAGAVYTQPPRTWRKATCCCAPGGSR
ncbi:FAD-linked oxidase C-terminal domain-containing protein [Streptomyces sp. NPDC059917]|uniref:FAD-linked oxidase C-terminal domain-containing protein n=1 Tax=Streptomyces sp. NPDC059917 TaxID=3347002 RepID=UPI003661A473